jgi:hypothetical protein
MPNHVLAQDCWAGLGAAMSPEMTDAKVDKKVMGPARLGVMMVMSQAPRA